MQEKKEGKSIPHRRMHGLMLLAALLVSTSFPVGAAITHGLDPAVLVLVRFILAAILFAPLIAVKYGLRFPSMRNFGCYALISGTIVGFFWCMFEALRYTSALHTSVIFTVVPGISWIYSALLLGERLDRNRLLALLLGMLGAIWVICRGDISRIIGLEINYGDLLFLAGCLLMGFYTPLVKLLYRKEPMAVMTFWVLVTGVVWLLLISGNRLGKIDWSGVEFRVWAGIVYLAVFTTIVTFFLTQLATLYLGPTTVSAYSYLYPSFVLVIDWCAGHGLPAPATMPGVAIVLLATVVLQRGAGCRDCPRHPPC